MIKPRLVLFCYLYTLRLPHCVPATTTFKYRAKRHAFRRFFRMMFYHRGSGVPLPLPESSISPFDRNLLIIDDEIIDTTTKP